VILRSAPPIVFIPTTDLNRAEEFYSQVLGLTIEDVDPYACVFRVGGTMVRLAKVPELRPQPFTIAGWGVDDIALTIDDLVSHGVRFERHEGMGQDGRGIWTAPGGAKVAWFKDPDGNVLSLTQFAR
jgi:predicted enzyme related to lactoylglutathione lyase